MTTQEKVKENLLRRMAARRGLALLKSRRRDPRALDYDRWRIMDAAQSVWAVPLSAGMTLDEVEAWLALPSEATTQAAAAQRKKKEVR